MIKPPLLPLSEIKNKHNPELKTIRALEKIKYGGVKLQSLPIKG
jgi:hypothetical protein